MTSPDPDVVARELRSLRWSYYTQNPPALEALARAEADGSLERLAVLNALDWELNKPAQWPSWLARAIGAALITAAISWPFLLAYAVIMEGGS